MRRLRSFRGRTAMARRPGEDGPNIELTPQARRIAGWVLAILIIVGIAVAVSLFGGDADEAATDASPSASTAGRVEEIAFGTAIDPATGEVAADAVEQTFGPGDTFAYSVRPTEPPPSTIFVEVRRTGGGAAETVQAPSPQDLPGGAEVIAFVVPADRLVEDFGEGDYLMLIYPELGAGPIAQGEFSVVEADASPPTGTGRSPGT